MGACLGGLWSRQRTVVGLGCGMRVEEDRNVSWHLDIPYICTAAMPYKDGFGAPSTAAVQTSTTAV